MVWFPASKQTHLSMNHGGHKHESERRDNTRFHLILWLNYLEKTPIMSLESALLNHFPSTNPEHIWRFWNITWLHYPPIFYKLDMLLDL